MEGERFWIVYPNSEQYGHLNIEEVKDLILNKED